MGWAEKTSTGYRAMYRINGKARSIPKQRWSRKADAVRAANAAEADARDSVDKTREEAEAARIEEKKAADNPGSITWALWCDDHWWPSRRVEQTTLDSDWHRIEVHVRPRWGEMSLTEIEDGGKEPIEKWLWELHDERELAASTVHKIKAVFSKSLSDAMTATPQRIKRNPSKGVNLPTIPPAEDRWFTREQVYDQIIPTIADVGGRDAEMLVKIKVATGTRWGEVAGLHRHRAHLDDLRIDVFESYSSAGDFIKAYPKGKRTRSVPITRDFATELRDWFEERPVDGTCGTRHGPGSRCRSGLIVPGAQGRVQDYDHFFRYVWTPTLQLCGIEHAGLHVLRHTFATWLIRAKVPKHIVQELLGHMDPKTTDRYTHSGEAGWEQIRAVLLGEAADNEALRRRAILDALRLIAAAVPDQRGSVIQTLVGDDVDLAEFATFLPQPTPEDDQVMINLGARLSSVVA